MHVKSQLTWRRHGQGHYVTVACEEMSNKVVNREVWSSIGSKRLQNVSMNTIPIVTTHEENAQIKSAPMRTQYSGYHYFTQANAIVKTSVVLVLTAPSLAPGP